MSRNTTMPPSRNEGALAETESSWKRPGKNKAAFGSMGSALITDWVQSGAARVVEGPCGASQFMPDTRIGLSRLRRQGNFMQIEERLHQEIVSWPSLIRRALVHEEAARTFRLAHFVDLAEAIHLSLQHPRIVGSPTCCSHLHSAYAIGFWAGLVDVLEMPEALDKANPQGAFVCARERCVRVRFQIRLHCPQFAAWQGAHCH